MKRFCVSFVFVCCMCAAMVRTAVPQGPGCVPWICGQDEFYFADEESQAYDDMEETCGEGCVGGGDPELMVIERGRYCVRDTVGQDGQHGSLQGREWVDVWFGERDCVEQVDDIPWYRATEDTISMEEWQIWVCLVCNESV